MSRCLKADPYQLKILKPICWYPPANYTNYKQEPFFYIIDETAYNLLKFDVTDAIVRPTRENVKLALVNFDNVSVMIWNENMEYAKKLLLQYLSMFIDKVKPNYEGLKMKYNTSPGYPLNLYFKQKDNVPEELVEQMFEEETDEVIWQMSMKRETLPLTKILKDNKMRSFMMPPMIFLMKQKIFCQDFNEKLKTVPYSAYGFNLHNLGFHSLISRIAKFGHVVDYDIKYWDKRFPLKKFCYDIRKEFLNMDEREEELFENLRRFEEEPVVLTPEGFTYKFQVGQCSGSENTTSDNIVAHLFIIFYEFICGWMELYNDKPILDHILKNAEIAVYSDDNISSYSENVPFMYDPLKKNEIFQHFGMKIEWDNPEKWNLSKTVIGHKFLGLEVQLVDRYYVWSFDYAKILNSTVLNKNEHSAQIRVQGFVTLLSLLVFMPEYDEYRKFIINYCEELNVEVPMMLSQRYAMQNEFNCEREGEGGRLVLKTNE